MSSDENAAKIMQIADETDQEKIKRLEAQIFQLKRIIAKLTGQEKPTISEVSHSNGARKKSARPFDFNLYKKRHVALHVCYFGWDYHGFAVQEIAGKTIESELFRALILTKLIKCREESNYHRCGRTDKGVSSFQQVITIDLRTNLLEGPGVIDFEGCKADERTKPELCEINYCKLLNANLPPHIQVIAWAPCPRSDFSARFDCVSRTYKYFFPRGDFDVKLMHTAGQLLLGEHDYRNFCKMDVANGVVNYFRNIRQVTAEALEDNSDSPYDMCVLTIKGKAFLWHQVRHVVAILFRVASGKEKPEIITELLDIESNPRKPQYAMASEIPLNLFHCDYQEDLEWNFDNDAVTSTLKQMQGLWTESAVKATMLKTALNTLSARAVESKAINEPVVHQADSLSGMSKAKTYIPLMEMIKCPSLEEKLAAPSRKRRKKVE